MTNNKSEVIYKFKKISESQKEVSSELKKEGVNPVLADLYALRGIENFRDSQLMESIESYKNLKDIEKAANILYEAIVNKDLICIVADYDVDGATACTIGLRGLKMFGANIDYVVPDRFLHGYGLTPSVVDEAIEKKNPKLIITVDNGISSYDGVDYANTKGIKVLVTDHHLAGDKLPNASCIVNPNQPDCSFKNKSLAGCGVIFYVLQALKYKFIEEGVHNKETSPNINVLIDLVAVGTVADLVKLNKDNRILVKHGLKLIRSGRTKKGIKALCEVSKKDYSKLSSIDIGFALGPRINAAGRLEDMTIGINCLLTEDETEAMQLAMQLNSINQSRKLIESEMKDQAFNIESLNVKGNSKVAYDSSFHEGVIGIVASRIKDFFYRPTIVFSDAMEEGLLKGSGRSIPEIHLRDSLDYVYKKNPNIIAKFGGHAMAAGLTIKKELLPEFEILFEEAINHYLGDKEIGNIKEIDMELLPENFNMETAEAIKSEIWGQGFLPPLFSGSFFIVEQKILKEAHLKLTLSKGNKYINAIWFFHNVEVEEEEINIAYSLDTNEFNNIKSVQIIIDGIIK